MILFYYTLLSYEYKSLDDLLQGNRGMDLFQTLKVNDSERPFRVRGDGINLLPLFPFSIK